MISPTGSIFINWHFTKHRRRPLSSFSVYVPFKWQNRLTPVLSPNNHIGSFIQPVWVAMNHSFLVNSKKQREKNTFNLFRKKNPEPYIFQHNKPF